MVRYSKLTLLLCVMVLAFTLTPQAYASPVTVSISPSSQSVPQTTTATYTVSLSGALATSYSLSLSGLASGASYAFSPNPLSTPPGGGTGSGSSSLSIATSNAPGLYCPGTYTFTVTTRNVTDGTVPPPGLQPPGYPNPDTGSASATLTVLQVGPPLAVTVTTDKSTYRIGDTVTIALTTNRPAEGYLTISPPSGAPATFSYGPFYTSYSLSKTLTANTIGRWSVTFQSDDFCSGFSSASANFDVTPDTYDVSVALDGIPPQYSAQLKVDDQPQGTIGGAEIKKLSFKIDSSHTISVDQYVTGSADMRYFTSQNTWKVSAAGSHTFPYETQYLLTVVTDPDGLAAVTGGGWVKAGTTVQTSQVPATVPGSAGTQYSFKGWELNGVHMSGNGISVTVDKPIKAVASYETQYQLVIDSPYGDPKGQGYYPAGSTARFSVTTPSGILIQQVFVRWEGGYTGTQPQGSITMDKPVTIHAVWTTSYIQLIAAIVIAAAAVGVFLFWKKRRGPGPETKPTPQVPGEAAAAAGSLRCESCGTENESTQKFCTNCGKELGHSPEHHT